MSIENARAHLSRFQLENKIIELNESSATVELAAEALGCEPKRIAKSITFMVQSRPVLIVTAGDARVDNAKFKAKFGVKAKMLTPEEVEFLIGHSVGGVCPFGIRDQVEVYLDISLKRFETVFPACGSSNSCIEMTLEELEKTSNFMEWVDICKGWQ